jgi:hypothetical protein
MSETASVLQQPRKIEPAKALFIKLGRSGKWEEECLKGGLLRFGYKQTPFDAATSGDWEAVRKVWLAIREDAGAATRDITQIRNFFEASEDVLWITFYGRQLWWCFARLGVKQDEEGSYRETVDGWHCADIHGEKLSMERLSGNLIKVQAFRGTICEVIAFDYLKRKINGEKQPEVEEAIKAEIQMVQKIIPLMRLMTWQDFELLVELVFSNSGWRRVGQLGRTQKTVDIELMLPTTNERAFVQIKSAAGKRDFINYREQFQQYGTFDRMFYIWHSGELEESESGEVENVVCIGPERLARMVFDAGLTSWLRDKVS